MSDIIIDISTKNEICIIKDVKGPSDGGIILKGFLALDTSYTLALVKQNQETVIHTFVVGTNIIIDDSAKTLKLIIDSTFVVGVYKGTLQSVSDLSNVYLNVPIKLIIKDA